MICVNRAPLTRKRKKRRNDQRMFNKKLTLKILTFLVVSDILETLTQYFFKKSAVSFNMPEVRVFWDMAFFLKAAFFSPYLWLGFATVLLTFIIWSTILSKIDLSVAVPVASFSYILVPLTSIIFLHEKISMLRWSGIFFILLGVIVVSLSTKETEAGLE